MTSLKTEFNSLLSINKSIVKDLAKRDKFFMVLTLTILSPKLDFVWDQILANIVIPSLDKVFARLLCVSSPNIVIGSFSPFSLNSSIFASQTQQKDHNGQGNQPWCSYCHKWGQTREKYYKLYGRPPRVANVIQMNLFDSSGNQS